MSANVSPSSNWSSLAIRLSSSTLTRLFGSNPAGYASPKTFRQIRSATADGGPVYVFSKEAFQSRSLTTPPGPYTRRFVATNPRCGSHSLDRRDSTSRCDCSRMSLGTNTATRAREPLGRLERSALATGIRSSPSRRAKRDAEALQTQKRRNSESRPSH